MRQHFSWGSIVLCNDKKRHLSVHLYIYLNKNSWYDLYVDTRIDLKLNWEKKNNICVHDLLNIFHVSMFLLGLGCLLESLPAWLTEPSTYLRYAFTWVSTDGKQERSEGCGHKHTQTHSLTHTQTHRLEGHSSRSMSDDVCLGSSSQTHLRKAAPNDAFAGVREARTASLLERCYLSPPHRDWWGRLKMKKKKKTKNHTSASTVIACCKSAATLAVSSGLEGRRDWDVFHLSRQTGGLCRLTPPWLLTPRAGLLRWKFLRLKPSSQVAPRRGIIPSKGRGVKDRCAAPINSKK